MTTHEPDSSASAASLAAPHDSASAAVASGPAPGFSRDTPDPSRFIPVLTLVLWLGCSIVGVLGFVMPYVRPQPAKPQPPPTQVEMITVELTTDPFPDFSPAPRHVLFEPPPLDAAIQPDIPQAVAVAEPSPAVSFAVPVEGPTRIVEVAEAAYVRPVVSNTPPASVAPAVQSLTFGYGAGRQPAPDYPLRAQREGQEGTVMVRFVVGENGRVISAEAVNPTPFPLLNNSAVQSIRNRWRFPGGEVRVYEVAIRFVLQK